MEDNTSSKGRILREAVKEKMQSVRSAGRPVHVISHKDGWAVTKEGAYKAAKIFPKKVDAVHRAQALVKQGAAAYLIVHKKDGSIERLEGTPKRKRDDISHQ